MNQKLAVLGKTALVTAAAYAVFSLFSQTVPYGLVWNRTASIPVGLYWSETITGEQASRNDLVCFDYAAPAWAKERQYLPEGLSVCKPVKGMAGDVINHEGDQLFVAPGGNTVQAELLGEYTHQDSMHRPLPQDALSSGVIPAGQLLLVAGAHANSLDSRYLGLVPVKAIHRRVHPIYTL